MALMRLKLIIMLLGLVIGCTQAISFPSLDDAVRGLPELSLLAAQFDTVAPALAAQLRAPDFVGTLFAPTNATLAPLTKYQSVMPASMMQDIFSMAVIPGPPLKLTDLVNGAVLTTLNNKTVTVKVTQAADGSGPIYYINQARVSGGNVYAGTLILHETFGLIVPPANQNLINAVSPKDTATPSATNDMSPEGPPQPTPSPSPDSPTTPSPAEVTPSPSPAAAAPSSSPPVTSPPVTSPSQSPSPVPSPVSRGVTASPSPSPAPAKPPSPTPQPPLVIVSPSPSPGNKGEVIAIPQPLPAPSPAAETPAPSNVVTESGTVGTTIPSTTNETVVPPSGAYSASSGTVAGAVGLIVPAIAGMLLL